LLPTGGATAAARSAASRGEPRSTSPEAWGEPVEMANGPPKMWKFGLEPRDFTYGLKKPMGNYESYGNDAVKPYGNMCDIFWKMILVAFFFGQRFCEILWCCNGSTCPFGSPKGDRRREEKFQLFTSCRYTYYIYIFSYFFQLYLYII
jgi:hypothetical protein